MNKTVLAGAFAVTILVGGVAPFAVSSEEVKAIAPAKSVAAADHRSVPAAGMAVLPERMRTRPPPASRPGS